MTRYGPMLLIPDSFTHDWYGWITNQSGHFLLGIVVAAITRRWWLALIIAITFELLQWSPDAVDSITDVAFTVAGSIFYIAHNNAILWGTVAALLAGMFQRRK